MPVSGVGGSGGVFWPESLGASSWKDHLLEAAKEMRQTSSFNELTDNCKKWIGVIEEAMQHFPPNSDQKLSLTAYKESLQDILDVSNFMLPDLKGIILERLKTSVADELENIGKEGNVSGLASVPEHARGLLPLRKQIENLIVEIGKKGGDVKKVTSEDWQKWAKILGIIYNLPTVSDKAKQMMRWAFEDIDWSRSASRQEKYREAQDVFNLLIPDLKKVIPYL